MSNVQSTPARRWAPWGAGLLGLTLVAGAAGWYGLAGSSAAVAEECRASQPVAARMAPFAKGEVAALAVSSAPKVPPAITFQGPDGQSLDLSAFRGKLTLVNLWATWCVPCRREMPALDRLQAELGSDAFQVVAINVDTRNPEKPKAWLKENGIDHLAYYAEPSGALMQVLQRSGHVVGLPTTVLIDSTGCEIGLMKGPAEWASPDALALVRAALGRSS